MVHRGQIFRATAPVWVFTMLSSPILFAQNPAPAQTGSGQSASASPHLPRLGLAVVVGTTGPGIEVATAVARKTNIRGGFNYFDYSLSGTNNNITYSGKIRLESAEILLDQYLAGPLHISAGAMVYNGFQASGTLSVPGGQNFTLNHVSYYSSASDPVNGTGLITARKVAPEVLFGLGNILPRGARHFGVNLDLGVAFQGSANATLNFGGSTCLTPSGGCLPISSDPSVQSNVQAQQGKLNHSLNPYWFYPVLRISFGSKL